MKLLFVKQTKHRIPRKFIEKFTSKLKRQLKLKRANNASLLGRELTLVFMTSRDMRKINREFRQRDKPTDVLSFDGLDPGSMGELLLCPEVIMRNSESHAWSYREELCYMITHGILHLMGYEHEGNDRGAKQRAKQMFDLQDTVFERCLRQL